MPRSSRFYLWISLVGLVLILLAALVFALAWVKTYLRSEEFLRLVSAKTGAAVHADTTYGPLRWSGNSVFSDNLQGSGLEGSPIQKIRADQIRAEINWRAILDGVWRINEVTVGYFDGTFQPQTRRAEDLEKPAMPKRPGGLWKYLPQRFELGSLQVAQARLGFIDGKGQQFLTINDTALSLRPEGAGWIIDGQRGTLAVKSMPPLSIDTFRSRLQKEAFFLTDAQLRLGDSGKITVSGELARDSRMEVEWQQVDVSPFLPTAWKTYLTGHLSGTSLIKWASPSASGATATGKVQLNDALLQGLPVLDQIATFTGAPQFRRMPLQQVTADYSWSGGVLTLTNFVAESKGLMRIQGGMVIAADGQIQSTLRVGVTPQTLQWLPGSRERVFTEALNGYVWTNVRVSGTLQNPQEDLSVRLVSAMGDEVIDRGVKVIESLPSAAPDAAKKALDLLSPLLR